MRFQSRKRARLMRQVKAEREEFVRQAGMCQVCDYFAADQCHEIACGSHREAALSERCTWLAVCGNCNCHALTDYSCYPLERQLAIKWIVDCEWFELQKFNTLRGRDPGAITMTDVIPEICRELDG